MVDRLTFMVFRAIMKSRDAPRRLNSLPQVLEESKGRRSASAAAASYPSCSHVSPGFGTMGFFFLFLTGLAPEFVPELAYVLQPVRFYPGTFLRIFAEQKEEESGIKKKISMLPYDLPLHFTCSTLKPMDILPFLVVR